MEQRRQFLSVKLSDAEKRRLEEAAASRGWTVSQLVRDIIRRLPNAVAPPDVSGDTDTGLAPMRIL